MKCRQFLSAISGNILEWYDFALYGFLAPIFANIFFKSQNSNSWINLLIVYGIFAISYLGRPFGSLLYGYIGDRFGRRIALQLSIGLMSIGMLIFACLPNFNSTGVLSIILLILIRLLQSISCGGEIGGSFIYVLESVSPKKSGLFGGATFASVVFGILLGSGVVAWFTTYFSSQFMMTWGWRLTYLIGAIFGLFAYFARRKIPESLLYQETKQQDLSISPIKEVIFHHKLAALKIFLLTAAPAAGFYFTFMYFPLFISQYFHKAYSLSLTINTLLQLAVIATLLISGWASDRIGKLKVLSLAAVLFVFLSLPMMNWLLQNGMWSNIIAVQCLFGLFVAIAEGPLPAIMMDITILKTRYTLLSFAYNTGFALFGGCAALISTLLVHWTGHFNASSIYLIFCGVLTLLGIRIKT